MHLKANPLAPFAHGDSPLALHIQMNWLGASSRDQRTARALADALLSQQQDDGSWNGSVADSIESLFDLWLLGARNKSTKRAINWLMETHRPPMRRTNADGGRYDNMFFHARRGDRDALRRLADVPFTPGCSGFVKTGAALFCALELKQGDRERIDNACATLSHLFIHRKGRPCTGSCNMSLLLAMSCDSGRFARDALERAIAWTAKQQDADGSWSKGIPFYEMTYVLARMPEKLAAGQFERAVARAVRLQHSDGTWGQSHRDLKAFLLLPALKRIGLLNGS